MKPLSRPMGRSRKTADQKFVAFTVSAPPALLEQFSQHAEQNQESRSSAIAVAMLEYLERRNQSAFEYLKGLK